MQKRWSVSCFLGMLACGGSPPPEPNATATSAPPKPEAEPSSTTPAAAATNASAAARPASPFHVIGPLPGDVRLFGVGERGFVVSSSNIVFALVGDEVVHDPLLQPNMNGDIMYSLEGVIGSWPDGAWLATTHPSGRSGFTKLWRWDGKRWVHRQSTSENHFVSFVKPWMGGRQLAVEQAAMMFDAKLFVISGDKNVSVPVLTSIKNPQGFCYTELRVEAFDTLPTGDVVAAGLGCGDESTVGLAVERWAPGAKHGTIETLPGAAESDTNYECAGMALRAANDITVAGKKYVRRQDPEKDEEFMYFAHFDGTRWQEVKSNVPGFVARLDTTSNRELLVTTESGELYVGSSIGSLGLVPLPPALYAEPELAPRINSVWSHAAGDIWAVAEMLKAKEKGSASYTGRFVLLHTRPATKPLPTPDEFDRKERAFRMPGPPVEWCETPFVLLYTLGKKAPADYDYPSTRAALKGHKEFAVAGVEFIEFERMDRRYFGARVPDFKLGKKLAELVKKDVPGSTPELVCHDPPPKRTLTLELASPQKSHGDRR